MWKEVYLNLYWFSINTLRPRQTCPHFADDILKLIFLNENVWILLKISLKFVLKVRINNIPALDQIMAWCRPGDKPLSEPMIVWLLMHICVTRPQWVKEVSYFITFLLIPFLNEYIYWRISDSTAYTQIHSRIKYDNKKQGITIHKSEHVLWDKLYIVEKVLQYIQSSL